MANITPAMPSGRQAIQSYGGGRFRIANEVWRGSVLVFRDRTLPWAVTAADGLNADLLVGVAAQDPDADILLIGLGDRGGPLDPALGAALRERGVVADAMTTGAACRTFNILLGEDRRVAAALIAVG